MPVTYRPGYKSPDDVKCSWVCPECNFFENITFREIAEVITELAKNESRLYPPEKGFKGGQMLLDFLQVCYDNGRVDKEIMQAFKLK